MFNLKEKKFNFNDQRQPSDRAPHKHSWGLPKVKSIRRFNGNAEKIVEYRCTTCPFSKHKVEKYIDNRVLY